MEKDNQTTKPVCIVCKRAMYPSNTLFAFGRRPRRGTHMQTMLICGKSLNRSRIIRPTVLSSPHKTPPVIGLFFSIKLARKDLILSSIRAIMSLTKIPA